MTPQVQNGDCLGVKAEREAYTYINEIIYGCELDVKLSFHFVLLCELIHVLRCIVSAESVR